MIPSRTRLGVRFRYILKLDPGASTLDARPSPWEAQRPGGVELPFCLPAGFMLLRCRVLDSRCVRPSQSVRVLPPTTMFSSMRELSVLVEWFL